MVSENLVASASVAETDRLLTMSENLIASAVEPESDRLLAATESLAASGVSGGYSGWRRRDRGLRLRREAHSRSGSFVENSLSSSCHVDHVHTRSVGRAHGEHFLHAACTNSCLVTHAARVNSFGLHSARGNSGWHIHFVPVYEEFMRWSLRRNKADEYEYSVPGRVSCCREAYFFTAGTRKVAC